LIVAGNVLLAVIITVPVPSVQVPPPSVPIVIAPPILIVPPAVILIVPVLPPILDPSNCKLPAVIRDPLVKVIIPTLLINKPTPPITKAPETESDGLPLVAKVKVAVVKLLFPSCNVAQVKVPFIVIVFPPFIVTLSTGLGTPPVVRYVRPVTVFVALAVKVR
jgi:hypothetical protein